MPSKVNKGVWLYEKADDREATKAFKEAGYRLLKCHCYKHEDGSIIPYFFCEKHSSAKLRLLWKKAVPLA